MKLNQSGQSPSALGEVKSIGDATSEDAGKRASGRRKSALVLCGTSGEIGGMERLVMGVARQLGLRDWRTLVLFSEAHSADALLSWAKEYDVPVRSDPAVVSVLDGRRSWLSVGKLARRIRSERPDVVNLHYSGGHISLKDVVAVRLARVPRCVVSVHHPVPWKEAGRKKRLLSKLAGRIADGIVVFSEAVRLVVLEAGVPDSKVWLTHPGVAVPTEVERSKARTTFDLGDDAFVVGCLARLVPEKGVDDLIRAFAGLGEDSGRPHVLLIAGEGPDRVRLDSLASEAVPGSVRLLGRLQDSELAEFYAALDVFALPSRLEGFGLAFVEAAMQGTPSIGANVGGVRSAVVDQVTGLLVNPEDVNGLREALCRVLNSPEESKRMGRAARERALTCFTEEAMGIEQERLLSGSSSSCDVGTQVSKSG